MTIPYRKVRKQKYRKCEVLGFYLTCCENLSVYDHSFDATFHFFPPLGTMPWDAPELFRCSGDCEPDNHEFSRFPSCFCKENETTASLAGLGPDGWDSTEVK